MGDERAERRLAAILAADVVGYSRLVGIDEEGTLAALKALRKSFIEPKIAEHRGSRRQKHGRCGRRSRAGFLPHTALRQRRLQTQTHD
jgi:class 3 adenylate cyclase